MKETIYLSVIIPAYNEEELIVSTISEIEQYLSSKEYRFEIIVVDDSSTDNTINLIESLKKNIIILVQYLTKEIKERDIQSKKEWKLQRGHLDFLWMLTIQLRLIILMNL